MTPAIVRLMTHNKKYTKRDLVRATGVLVDDAWDTRTDTHFVLNNVAEDIAGALTEEEALQTMQRRMPTEQELWEFEKAFRSLRERMIRSTCRDMFELAPVYTQEKVLEQIEYLSG